MKLYEITTHTGAVQLLFGDFDIDQAKSEATPKYWRDTKPYIKEIVEIKEPSIFWLGNIAEE